MLDVRVETERSIGALVVAYGTGVYDPKHDSVDLIVEERTEYKALGLHKPTRFALALNQRMLLPWCTEYFVPPAYVKGVGIVAGALSAEQIARLIDCLEARGLRPY